MSQIFTAAIETDEATPLAQGAPVSAPANFEDITRLAAILCQAPKAFVALAERGENGRSCPRTDMDGLQTFAAVPLVGGAGAPLGFLMVMDSAPRALTSVQRERLEMLARQAAVSLELQRANRELTDAVAALREAQTTIRRLAYHDTLTGLPSRELFRERLGRALAHARRREGSLAVMFLDLDGFKSVNDTWGHAAGDRLLVGVAERLSGALRATDTVARMGGDEFAILCPGMGGEGEAEIVARKLLETFQSPIPVDGLGLSITASIGIALYPMDGATPESLLLDADAAMYRAKRNGKNTYAFCVVASRKVCRHVP